MQEEQHITSVPVGDSYDENQIQVLEGLEAVRKRPGMYIGSTTSRGLHHLVYEIVDNSIDEALAGYCTRILVEIEEDNSITVTDNGRGIPTGIHPKMGIPAVEVVFTQLHAGGKFGGGGYKVSGGLHGVGASVVNALSEFLEVTIRNGEHVFYQKYERGHSCGELKQIGDTSETGTIVHFKPDGEIFEDLVYDYDVLRRRLREQAFLNAGIELSLIHISPAYTSNSLKLSSIFALFLPIIFSISPTLILLSITRAMSLLEAGNLGSTLYFLSKVACFSRVLKSSSAQ